MTFIKNKKTNNGAASAYRRQDGFTIVEAIVAIFILTVSVSSMLGVTASSIASARYARNEITANYLLQEAVDSIRNSRDTIAFERRESYGDAWTVFLDRYGYNGSSKCFSDKGCYLDTENFKPEDISGPDVVSCDGTCPLLNIDNTAGYNYSTGTTSIFTRWVKMEVVNADEVKVTANINWKNESTSTPKSQSLEIYLLNWQK